MNTNHQDSTKSYNRLFHVSEEHGISLFDPRPSPSFFESIKGNVVFAITERLLHNYLLPRDCPRITFYATEKTTADDKEQFFGNSAAEYVVMVESAWYRQIKQTTLYCYEFPPESFTLLDECAGYYISYEPVEPVEVTVISDLTGELLKRNIELRFTPSLIPFVDPVVRSTLNFSLIRMRNAQTVKRT
jgi:hypothetical protein